MRVSRSSDRARRGTNSDQTLLGLCAWLVILVALSGCGNGGHAAPGRFSVPGAPPDIAGMWLPDGRRAQAWPADLPLTPKARAMLEHYNPAASDPTTFCMPLGTPRNMLQTEYPLEVVQTPQLVMFVVQPDLSNTEVRRIPLDGTPLPDAPEASWYGTSQGHWDGSTLVVETVGMRPDAPVGGNGLMHSEGLRVIERLSLSNDDEHRKVLVDEIELRDPMAYQQPLKTRRFFVWAPLAQPREGHCDSLLWIDKLWRDRLAEHAAGRRQAGKSR